ncbi:BstXI family restriction endonuclease [bacterium AH-315-M05]|nr:BstXI family restriction endonuclease [bacterium AH-315-M05]
MAKKIKISKLPSLLDRKIYKTGQTRGADDDVIFQNRVNRNSTVLIPYPNFEICNSAPDNKGKFENGFIVLIKPEDYFDNPKMTKTLKKKGLELGKNALLFYETREQWRKYHPSKNRLRPAKRRRAPLGGKFVARVPSTTSQNDAKILVGFTTSWTKGAGIRVYEYSSKRMMNLCRIQLEYLFWNCADSIAVVQQEGMSKADAKLRMKFITEQAEKHELADKDKLKEVRIINDKGRTICPLCLKMLSANGFFNRLEQAEGRDVPDLTVTQINLFHIRELRTGEFNHRSYNLGWGHHHCNMVTKDSGIEGTLKWMNEVLQTNIKAGFKF